MLDGEDVPPRISPCFGGFNQLQALVSVVLRGIGSRTTDLGKHLVCLLKIIEEHSNLGLIGGAREEFPEASLHALHFENSENPTSCVL